MTGEQDDSLKSDLKSDPPAIETIADEDLVRLLRKRPDFLIEHPDLLDSMNLPARFDGNQVVDFQHEALKRLRAKQDRMVDNSRSNMSVQLSTHEAVLAMLEARSLDELIGIIQDEVPILLDIDMAAVALEGAVEAIDMSAEGMPVLLPIGEVQSRLEDDDVRLYADIESGDDLFGAMRDLVQSVALARLYPSDVMPSGLMILGSRDEGAFHPAQGTELITFMARVVEILVEKWLEESDR